MDTNPSSIKWRQIKTEGFQIIFPEGSEEEANKVANNLEHIREPETRTMGENLPKRIPIVLQSNNSISNGFVTLGPRRSELYSQPSQDYSFIGSNQWMTLLTAHEYRHIAQYNRSKTGLNKLFYYLFGQNTQAAMAAISAPRWFWEGDATLMETVVTSSGRGRIPSFDRVFRSNLLEGKRFNYNKQHLQSFKDYVPDHYRLGYFMNVHLRRRTKNGQVWNAITKSSFGSPIVPFTFSNAMKKHTDHYLVDNYEMMMDDMYEIWNDQIADLNPSEFTSISKERVGNSFTDFSTPQFLEDESIVVYRTGINNIGQLVRLDQNGNEIDYFTTGVMNSTGMLSAVQYKVYWNEYEYNPRWGAKTYSVIKSYDFATKQFKRITNKSRYSGVSVSPDGYKLVTTLNALNGESHLVVLDALTGNEIKKITNDSNAEYGMASWSPDGKSIVSLKITEDGKSVIKINYETNEETSLVSESNENIGNPILVEDYLYFSSPINGIDNIYAIQISTGKRYQITKSKYGAYSPAISASGKQLLYANHSVDGLNAVTMPLDRSTWISNENIKDRNIRLIDPIVEQEGLSNLMGEVPNTKYESKKYSKIGHMFNLHSWGPLLQNNVNSMEIGVFSKDVLSTTKTYLGYTYDVIEGTGFANAKLSYQGWFPVIDFEFEYGERNSSGYKWDETTTNAGIRIPLNLTNSKYFENLTISNSVGIRQISNFERSSGNPGGRDLTFDVPVRDQNNNVIDSIKVYQVDIQELDNGEMIFNDFEISYSSLLKLSKRNIRSRWGQSFVFKQLNTISGDFSGATTGIRGVLYFPSPFQLIAKKLFVNHSLNFRFGYQKKSIEPDINNYSFRNVIFKPRGFSYPTEESFKTFVTNYEFPLLYPDLSIGPFLFIKRVKANLFFDYGQDNVVQYVYTTESFNDFKPDDLVISGSLASDYISYGAELTFDFNIMRFPVDFEMGVRFVNVESNVWNKGGSQIELLIGAINF